MKICRGITNFVKAEQKYRTLYTMTQVSASVAISALLSATCSTTMHRKGSVAFTRRQCFDVLL